MNAQRQQNRAPLPNNLRELAPIMNIGLELAAIVGVCGAIGYAVDHYAATRPFWFVALLIFGVVGGMIKFVRTVLRFTQRQSEQKGVSAAKQKRKDTEK
jgi:F0F1-type ATP synthase assembly protein I